MIADRRRSVSLGFVHSENWLSPASMRVSRKPKIAVMEAEAASEFPYALDRIQLGTVRREIIEREFSGVLFFQE